MCYKTTSRNQICVTEISKEQTENTTEQRAEIIHMGRVTEFTFEKFNKLQEAESKTQHDQMAQNPVIKSLNLDSGKKNCSYTEKQK